MFSYAGLVNTARALRLCHHDEGVRGALTVLPGRAGSLAVTEVPVPELAEHELLVDGLAGGVRGTEPEDLKLVLPPRRQLPLGENDGRIGLGDAEAEAFLQV